MHFSTTFVSQMSWLEMDKVPLETFKLLESKRTFVDFGHFDAGYGSVRLVNQKLSSSTTLLKEYWLVMFLLYIKKLYGIISIQIASVLAIMFVLIEARMIYFLRLFLLTNVILNESNFGLKIKHNQLYQRLYFFYVETESSTAKLFSSTKAIHKTIWSFYIIDILVNCMHVF